MLAKTTGTLAIAAVLSMVSTGALARDAAPDKCRGGDTLKAGTGKDLLVTGECKVDGKVKDGLYKYGEINIYSGGKLIFADASIDLWAKSIIVENEGSLLAGTETAPIAGPVTIHLYGADQGAGGEGALCVLPHCGIPDPVWITNGKSIVTGLPGGAPDDYFYQYGPLAVDTGDDNAYFGYKVIGVGYGGTLALYGKKGATYGALDSSSSGTSWRRLAKSVSVDSDTIELDLPVDWVKDDEVVITTTDYLPGHSEQVRIKEKVSTTIFKVAYGDGTKLKHAHNGFRFKLPSDLPGKLGISETEVETRAAVALLSRSIRIVSEGASYPNPLGATSFIGGHTLVRQGAMKFQVQGVEFRQLGQGGRLGHYPVHFHHARKVPPNTFVKDSSVNESMTRWIVLHGTHNVTLARNVGWKSIGHGYYLEDGTEIDNNLLSNIGIWARPAIDDSTVNPRKVPGILAAETANGLSHLDPSAYRQEYVPFYSDYDHPAIFWVMNAWNSFEHNMAVGAGACGVCYWILPGANSGHSRHQTWTGYASMQADSSPNADQPTARAGLTPLKSFVGNYCSTASMSLNTTGNTAPCLGIGAQNIPNKNTPFVASVKNPLAPKPCDQSNPRVNPDDPKSPYRDYACAAPANEAADDYYPQIGGGGRFPTRCDTPNGDCSKVPQCSDGHLEGCMVTVIDKYTSSFHWAETNFSAIWLRPQWYLYQNSFLTDVINGGLTFITGGGYTSADVVPGHWALAYRNVFIGQTQDDSNAMASAASPINPKGLACDGPSGNHCLVASQGLSFPKGNFGINQRMFNIYDGPAYQDSNGYINIKPIEMDCTPGKNGGQSNCGGSRYLAGPLTGLPQAANKCYMPQAAIGWKQPNGFYYPPAFHSNNLYFGDEVAIRHYVTQPLFDPGTYITKLSDVQARYCNWTPDMFNNWTDVDRQTELNDDDGSLTGYVNTISVNEDPFFNGPKEGIECASDTTAKTSPYDYVTTVIYPRCGLDKTCPLVQSPFEPNNQAAKISSWNADCTNQTCSGVPLYRLLYTGTEMKTPPVNPPAVRMAGQATFQRSTLSPNNGVFYIDTTPGTAKQATGAQPPRQLLNVFQKDGVYYVFLLFAKPTTTQTYKLYVGPGFKVADDFFPVQANVKPGTPIYTKLATLPSTWPKPTVDADGILTVTMDMGFNEFKTNYDSERAGKCGPASFCSPQGQSCGCAANAIGCTPGVCQWAVKDVDCPTGGCYGFGFKLPNGFTTDLPVPRPKPDNFAKDAKTWDVPWVAASQSLAGTRCYNAPKNPDNF
jgi:hypothetical protein